MIRSVFVQVFSMALAMAVLIPAPALPQQPGAAAGAPPQNVVKVQAKGEGSYHEGDLARSKSEALEAAFRDAVEQASGVFISSESETREFELVKDEVLTHSQGFVKKYTVVREGRDAELYTIVIDAEVERAAFVKDMDAALELLYQRVGKPRVMAFIREVNNPLNDSSGIGSDALGVTEKEIRQVLLKQGFKFIDARTAGGQSIVAQVVGGAQLQRNQAVDLAKHADADILILGNAQTQYKGKIQSFHSIQANLSLDVVRVDNGQVMASESVSAPGIHVDAVTAGINGLKKAANDITPKMMEQVSYLWVKERNEGGRYEIVVKNISFGDLLAFRRALGNQVRGVKQVTQRSYTDGVALIEIQSKDKLDAIAESLYNVKFEKFKLEIEDMKSNRMTVNVSAR
jgi:hypothetical protein